jgi:hypothetical protein
MIILEAVAPSIEKWLPTRAAVVLTTSGAHPVSLTTASLLLAGYAAALLVAARFATLNRDIA